MNSVFLTEHRLIFTLSDYKRGWRNVAGREGLEKKKKQVKALTAVLFRRANFVQQNISMSHLVVE